MSGEVVVAAAIGATLGANYGKPETGCCWLNDAAFPSLPPCDPPIVRINRIFAERREQDEAILRHEADWHEQILAAKLRLAKDEAEIKLICAQREAYDKAVTAYRQLRSTQAAKAKHDAHIELARNGLL